MVDFVRIQTRSSFCFFNRFSRSIFALSSSLSYTLRSILDSINNFTHSKVLVQRPVPPLLFFMWESKPFFRKKFSMFALPSHATKKKMSPILIRRMKTSVRMFYYRTTFFSTSSWTISNNPFWIAKLRGASGAIRCVHIRSGIDQQFYDFKIRFAFIDRVNQGRCIGQSFRIQVASCPKSREVISKLLFLTAKSVECFHFDF